MSPDENDESPEETPGEKPAKEPEFPPHEEKFVDPDTETVEKVIEHGRHMGF
jgi:hypothetical protein